MEYQLTINGYEKNEDYVPPESISCLSPGYDSRNPEQRKYEYERKYLSVRITEEQFEAIRKAVLDKF